MFLCNLWQLGKGSLVPVKYTVDMNTGMPEKILGTSVLTLEKYDFICSCIYDFFFNFTINNEHIHGYFSRFKLSGSSFLITLVTLIFNFNGFRTEIGTW